ncbi:hypothetical protein AAOE16_14530 [Ekhidna sp. MALMAid0563]|uniref:hypothetical protein n=1 Tax=Ekhidna sp. MALMAid0563 TaxID=3143937 RepID=UPI0032DEDE3C
MSKNFFIAIKGVMHKSRESFFLLVLSGIFLLSACGKDEVELPDEVLQGKIDGEEWTYKSANAYLESADFRYRVTFLSTEETVSDPCALRSTAKRHITAFLRFPEYSGDYTLTPQLVNDNEVVVTFNADISGSLVASSGFMSIFAIENRVVFGYLQAVLDDDNTVEGSFQIRLCN